MLKKLLELTAKRGTARTTELVCELGVSPLLVHSMLQQLVHQGYLIAMTAECSTHCKKCPLHVKCSFCKQPRIWALSGKGESLIVRLGKMA